MDISHVQPGDQEQTDEHNRLIDAATRKLSGGSSGPDGFAVPPALETHVGLFELTGAMTVDSTWGRWMAEGKRVERRSDPTAGTKVWVVDSTTAAQELWAICDDPALAAAPFESGDWVIAVHRGGCWLILGTPSLFLLNVNDESTEVEPTTKITFDAGDFDVTDGGGGEAAVVLKLADLNVNDGSDEVEPAAKISFNATYFDVTDEGNDEASVTLLDGQLVADLEVNDESTAVSPVSKITFDADYFDVIDAGGDEAEVTLVLGGTGVRWGKVQTGFSNVDKPATKTAVSVKSCDIDGGSVAGDAFDVYAPTRANKATSLFTGDVVGWQYDDAGVRTIVTDCFDAIMNAIEWFAGTVADIPNGWELCDGNNGAIDLSGRFIMCIDEDGLDSENTIGDTGGHRWHGLTENNHPDHEFATEFADDNGDGSSVEVIMPAGIPPAVHYEDHSGTDPGYNSGEDTDNRPPYYVLAAMQRVS